MHDKAGKLEGLRIARAEEARGKPVLAWLAGGLTILVVVGIGLWTVFGSAGQGAVAEASAAPQQPAAAPPPSNSLLDASGYVVARRMATVSSKITGRIVEVPIEEGQRVEKGQILGRLDDTNARAALAQAEARVAQAQANFDSTNTALTDDEAAFARNEDLFKKGIISAQDVETARALHNAKRMAMLVAKQMVGVEAAARDVARQNLTDTVVRAPYAGIVTVKAAQAGEIVSPGSTGGFTRTGICTIVDMDSLEVEVDVSESFISRVHPGLAATVRLNAYPDWEIPAEVLAVIPTADRAKATVKVRIAFKLKDPRIVPEMGARVAFLDEKKGEARR